MENFKIDLEFFSLLQSLQTEGKISHSDYCIIKDKLESEEVSVCRMLEAYQISKNEKVLISQLSSLKEEKKAMSKKKPANFLLPLSIKKKLMSSVKEPLNLPVPQENNYNFGMSLKRNEREDSLNFEEELPDDVNTGKIEKEEWMSSEESLKSPLEETKNTLKKFGFIKSLKLNDVKLDDSFDSSDFDEEENLNEKVKIEKEKSNSINWSLKDTSSGSNF